MGLEGLKGWAKEGRTRGTFSRNHMTAHLFLVPFFPSLCRKRGENEGEEGVQPSPGQRVPPGCTWGRVGKCTPLDLKGSL